MLGGGLSAAALASACLSTEGGSFGGQLGQEQLEPLVVVVAVAAVPAHQHELLAEEVAAEFVQVPGFLKVLGQPVLDVVLHSLHGHPAPRRANGTKKKTTTRISSARRAKKVGFSMSGSSLVVARPREGVHTEHGNRDRTRVVGLPGVCRPVALLPWPWSMPLPAISRDRFFNFDRLRKAA